MTDFLVGSSLTITGEIDLQNYKIVNAGQPSNSGDLATIDYVDAQTSSGSIIEDTNLNIFTGSNAGFSITSASDNLLIGVDAGKLITSGFRNTALGNGALSATAGDIANNIAIGYAAGKDLTGNANTFIGTEAGLIANISDSNVGIGQQSMFAMITGIENVAVGRQTLYGVGTKNHNVAIGTQSLHLGEIMDANVAVGGRSFYNLQTGNNNTAIGHIAGINMTGASSGNVLLGYNAGPTISATYNNELYIHNSVSDTPLIHGDFLSGTVTINGDLVVTGSSGGYSDEAAQDAAAAALVSGTHTGITVSYDDINNKIDLTVASANVIFTEDINLNLVGGEDAGSSITTGFDNIFIGSYAGGEVTTGDSNIAIGIDALASGGPVHQRNIAIGASALLFGSSVTDSIAIGDNALAKVTIGNQNTGIGYLVGNNLNAESSSNILLGNRAGPTTLGQYSDELYIHNEESDTPLIHGDFATGSEKITINGDFEVTGAVTGAFGGSAFLTEDVNFNIVGGTGVAANLSAVGAATNNILIGKDTGSSITWGDSNVIIGNVSMYTGTGDYNSNTGLGHGILQKCQANQNTAIGTLSFANITTGGGNVGLGWRSALTMIDGSQQNVVIGHDAGPSTTAVYSNELYIHNSRTDNPLIHGDFAPGSEKITINGDFEVTGAFAGAASGVKDADGDTFIKIDTDIPSDSDTITMQIGIDETQYDLDDQILFSISEFIIAPPEAALGSGNEGIPFTIRSGSGTNASSGGELNLWSGSGEVNGGNINISAGVASSGIGGNIILYPGFSDTGIQGTVTIARQNSPFFAPSILKFQHGTTDTGFVGLQAPTTVTSNVTYTLPVNDGVSGEALVTDGSGILSWASGGGLFTEAVNNNIIGGTGAGAALTTGTDNFFAGFGAGAGVTSGDYNIAIGNNANGLNDSNGTIAIGHNAGAAGIGDNAIAIGRDAMSAADTANSSIAIGQEAMQNSGSSSIQNIAIGYRAARAMTQSDLNIAIGRNAMVGASGSGCTGNTIIGHDAGDTITTGDSNIGIGSGTLVNLTSGDQNVAIGRNAGQNIGSYSKGTVCIGNAAGPTPSGLYNNQLFINNTVSNTPLIHGDFASPKITINGDFEVTGAVTGAFGGGSVFTLDASDNLYAGNLTGSGLTTGGENIIIGTGAGEVISSGSYNVCLGSLAGKDITTAQDNICIGRNAAGKTDNDGYLIAIGLNALSNYTNVFPSSTGNIAIGNYAGASRKNQEGNIDIGANAAINIGAGSNSVAIGTSAMEGTPASYLTNSGGLSVAIGYRSMKAVTTGNKNVSVGANSCLALTTGTENTVVGQTAANSLTTGIRNTIIGNDSLGGAFSTGSNNVAIGYKTAFNVNANSSNSIFIGPNAGPTTNVEINDQLFINNATDSTPLIHGDFASPKITINGDFEVTGELYLPNPTVPATATSPGIVGQMAWDANFIYVCTATNTWVRTATATW